MVSCANFLIRNALIMRPTKIKTPVLLDYANAAYKDITNLHHELDDLVQNLMVTSPLPHAMKSDRMRYYIDNAVGFVKKCDDYFASPANGITTAVDIADEISRLISEIDDDLADTDFQEIAEPHDMRQVFDCEFYTQFYIDRMVYVLSFCELHKCASLTTLLQALVIRTVFIMQYIIYGVAGTTKSTKRGNERVITTELHTSDYLEDMLERFGMVKYDCQREIMEMTVELHTAQVAYNDMELAQMRQAELERREAEKKAKEVALRVEYAQTYAKEILDAYAKLQENGYCHMMFPPATLKLLSKPETEEDCATVEQFCNFLRILPGMLGKNVPNRAAAIYDALVDLEGVVDSKNPLYVKLMNMFTPTVVRVGLTMLGNRLTATVMSTKADVMTDDLSDLDLKQSIPISITAG